MGLFNVFSRTAADSRTLVVDTGALFGAMGLKGRVTPRDQLRVLRRLARLAGKEKLQVIAVLQGKSLRKAPDQESFEGVQVRYAETREKLEKLLLKYSGKGRRCTVVTDARKVETVVLKCKGALIHSSTLAKAMDNDGEFPRAQQRKGSGRRGQKKTTAPRKEQPQSENTENSEDELINELIDLV